MFGTMFLIMILLLQLFTFGLGRSLQWLFAPVVGKVGRRWLMGVSYFVTNGLLAGLLLELGHFMFRIMAFWMVLLLFVMYAALATFILFLLLRKFVASRSLSRSLRLFAPLFVFGLVGFGLYNAYTPVVRHQTVVIDKKMDKPLRIGVASDLHLGILFGARQLDKLVDIMNREKVDLILLPGDLMDDNVDAYRKENMQPLQGHGGCARCRRTYRDCPKSRKRPAAGITVLGNQVLQQDAFLLVGRNDDLDHDRPSVAQLLENHNTDQPVLLMDHRPTEVEAHATLPIDVQVSGHVHNGQIAPANLIVRTLYRLAYGYEEIGGRHFFVTSGYGFWGIPLRLGSQSEVWVIDVKGK